MRKLLILVLIVAVLCGTAAAYEAPVDFKDLTLEEAMEEFMAAYQLTENNFSLSYYNTVTGETYHFNENKFSIAASTYKLPLNMYFYEMEQAGQIDPGETFMWTGMTLSEVHRQSILFSNNEVSEAMTAYWNNYYIYRENMRKYSSMPLEEIDEYYYLTNASCTRMMLDTLKYLYDNSDKFEEMIGYMKDAVPGEYFKAGVQEYEVAHKYGAIDEFVNDVAIIYTPQPILLAVYTQIGSNGNGICAQAARLLTNYTVWQADQSETLAPEQEEAPAEELQEEVTAEEPKEETPAEEPREETPAEEPKEETPAEMPEQEAPAEEEAPVEEETPEEAAQRALELKQQEAQRRERNKKILWASIGILSILVIVCIPILLRKRV